MYDEFFEKVRNYVDVSTGFAGHRISCVSYTCCYGYVTGFFVDETNGDSFQLHHSNITGQTTMNVFEFKEEVVL